MKMGEPGKGERSSLDPLAQSQVRTQSREIPILSRMGMHQHSHTHTAPQSKVLIFFLQHDASANTHTHKNAYKDTDTDSHNLEEIQISTYGKLPEELPHLSNILCLFQNLHMAVDNLQPRQILSTLRGFMSNGGVRLHSQVTKHPCGIPRVLHNIFFSKESPPTNLCPKGEGESRERRWEEEGGQKDEI